MLQSPLPSWLSLATFRVVLVDLVSENLIEFWGHVTVEPDRSLNKIRKTILLKTALPPEQLVDTNVRTYIRPLNNIAISNYRCRCVAIRCFFMKPLLLFTLIRKAVCRRKKNSKWGDACSSVHRIFWGYKSYQSQPPSCSWRWCSDWGSWASLLACVCVVCYKCTILKKSLVSKIYYGIDETTTLERAGESDGGLPIRLAWMERYAL